ncbi:IclR family transcriptional regulator [Halostella sp. JP-L12]|uniref:IclR family transcriptional regulator n=1 Tax=Halostella TaxID=1843185 RepID=UPI000EF7B87F|nr:MULTISPECIES: IclR family transcriptional regulator [Halostella]NHN49126.1 IclR family transcriptional regulator [Halostella sp. JP-L12]
MEGDREHPRPVQTVETASTLLERIKERGGATLPELTAELDLAKSTVHRHLGTLEELDFVVRDGDEYRVGLRMLDFGIHAREQQDVFHEATDTVDELAAETGEKVWLITHEHGRSVHLYGATGKRSVRTPAREGEQGYLHQLAAGKAILATFPRERVERVVDEHGLPAATDRTITDTEPLFEELAAVRERGFAFNRGESIPRLNAVGAAITDDEGEAVAAISVSGPSNRVKGDFLTKELPDLLLGVTNEVEINLSYT